MKTTDLMIGDWFVTKKAKKMPMRIISIDKFIYGKTADGIKIGPFFAEEVVPIPLTPEILEKNGFVEINDDKKWYKMQLLEENDFVGLEKLEDCYWMFGAVFFPNLINQLFIKYVHELQHVLKLCEIENEIVL